MARAPVLSVCRGSSRDRTAVYRDPADHGFQPRWRDAAIRFGTGSDEGFFSEVLADDWAIPVCTQDMADRIAETGSLDGIQILHDESTDFLDPRPDWAAWGRISGVEADWTHGAHFTNADHSIDVALEGGGIALGRIVLVERYLETGRLVTPFKIGIRTGGQFRFVCPRGAETHGRVATLLTWMREEMRCIETHQQGLDIQSL